MILTEKHDIDKSSLIDGIENIESSCFSDAWSKNSIENQIFSDGSVFACVREENEITGYVCGQIICDECELYRIAVLGSRRGKGYAKALMECFIKECQGRDVKSVFLEVRSSNLSARGLYEKYGFQSIGERKRYYQNPTEDAVIYKKEI